MDRKLLDAEWTILRALWGQKPRTMGEIISAVQEEQPDIGWQYKTYHSYLRIMLDKGLIGCEEKNKRDKLYYPLVSREEALRAEGESLLSRISVGSMGALVATMAASGQLSDMDRQQLLALAERLERKGGEQQ